MDKRKVSILGSFLADAHALCSHWCYDPSIIAAQLDVAKLRTTLLPPTLVEYHRPKQAGDFTNYGDQALMLLQCLKKGQAFKASDFDQHWRQAMKTYTGYIHPNDCVSLGLTLFRDGASKDTLANEQGNTTSTDFTAASRFPSLLLISKSESEFVDAAIAQSSVTHQHPSVKGATAFMAHSIWRIVQSGQPPSVVFPLVAKDLDSTYPETVALAHKGIAGVEKSPEQFSQDVGERKQFGDQWFYTGKACPIPGALPIVIQLAIKFETAPLMDALVANVLVGGETATRGMALGALLGPIAGIPEKLVRQMKQYAEIERLLEHFA